MFESLIVTYTESGKARKPCPCGKFVHARSGMCTCGHEFRLGALKFYREKETATPIMSKSEESGRGKKQCDSCKSFVGVRTKLCSCGFDFAAHKKPIKEKINTITDEDRNFAIVYGYPSPRSYVYCPSGDYKGPKSIDDDGFDNWVECHIIDDGRVMTPTAYRYMLRQCYSDDTLKRVLEKFNSWVQQKLNCI